MKTIMVHKSHACGKTTDKVRSLLDHESPEAAIRSWIVAWRERDWNEMLVYTQRHWVATLGKKAAADWLERSFYSYLPREIHGYDYIERPGLNIDVMRDYDVGLVIAGEGPPIFELTICFRVIRENRFDRRPWWKRWWRKARARMTGNKYVPMPDPDPEGAWGVNPVSVLRGWGGSPKRK